MKTYSAFLNMKRCKDWDHEISSWKYLSKDLSHQIPCGSECLIPPWSPSGVLKVNSCGRTGFSLHRGGWLMPLVVVAVSPWQMLLCVCHTRFSRVQLCDRMDCTPTDSSARGILQARILEWVAMPSSRGSSWPRDQIRTSSVSWIGGPVLYH